MNVSEVITVIIGINVMAVRKVIKKIIIIKVIIVMKVITES